MVNSISKDELIFSDQQITVLNHLEADDETTEIFFGGAAGGGKSFIICHWQTARRLHFPGTRGFIGRESLKNLKLTTFKTFIDVWENYYKDNDKGVTWALNGSTNIINFSNGSEIVLMDLGYYPSDPEFHRLGSLEITDAAVDELAEIKKNAFEILQSRIRYRLEDVGSVPKCLATGNPSHNWVKSRYIQTETGDNVKLKEYQKYVRATVHDNPNEAFKQTYIKALERLDPIHRQRLLFGSWDVQMNDNPFFYSFNREKHYKPEPYNINVSYPVDLSFDFNKDPCSLIVGQFITHEMKWNICGAYFASPNERSSLFNLCQLVKQIYFPKVNRFNLRITGDSSGRQGDADRAVNANRYTSIIQYLGISKSQIFVDRQNLRHEISRDLVNDVLHSIPKNHFTLWAGTERLLEDINASYPDARGSLERAKREHGLHLVDAFRYLIKFWFARGLTPSNIRQYQKFVDQMSNKIKANETRTKMEPVGINGKS